MVSLTFEQQLMKRDCVQDMDKSGYGRMMQVWEL